MKPNKAAVSQRKVKHVEERGTAAAGLPFMFSLQTAPLRLGWQIEVDGRRGEMTQDAGSEAIFVNWQENMCFLLQAVLRFCVSKTNSGWGNQF